MRKALLPLTILFTLGLRMKACVSIVLLFALVYASGCASVVHGTTQAVPVNSSPVGADVKVNCGKAASATGSLKTPTTVLLKRNAEPCNITVSREGYEDGSIVFVRKMSGWFWGNIFIGGIIGMIIDGADGAIYNRAPESASVSLAPLSSPTPRPESATPSTSLTPVTPAPPAPPAPTPAPASARAPAPAPSPTSRPAPPALAVGTMLFSKDGAPFGTVKLITRSAVSVSRVNGGIVTMTREEAVSMQTKRDQVSTTPPAKAPAPTAAPARAPALARTAAEPEVAARGAKPKPVPPTLAVGTKLFNPDGSLFGTVTILGRSAAAVLLANGYSTITMPRKQAVGMQR